MKKGILVVSFGTSYEETRRLAIRATENRIQKEFEDYEVRRAFTSQMIINKLKSRDNISIDNVEEALDKMKADGFIQVYIQPLHIILGHEYEKIIEQAEKYKQRNIFESLKIGKPVLDQRLDYEKVVDALRDEVVDAEESIIFMGHGSDHIADESYLKLEDTFRQKGYENVFIPTVEGSRTLEDIIIILKEKNIKKTKLTPLMLVAGDHAINDMASDEKDSWKSKLLQEGIQVDISLKGLGEIEEIQEIYIDHLTDILGR